jgi:hypothetical protein
VLVGLYPPTLEEASVRLLRVELLPAEGFPTKPIRGSRGIVVAFDGRSELEESSQKLVEDVVDVPVVKWDGWWGEKLSGAIRGYASILHMILTV